MKVLVWIGCFVVFTFLNELLGQLLGIKLGYLLLYGLVSLVATSICKAMGDDEPEQQPAAPAPVPRVPREDWTCASCGMVNRGHIATCQSCGVSKAWSDSKTKEKKVPEKAVPAMPEPEPEPVVKETPAPVRKETPAVIITPVAPAPEPEPETTRWICPKCGLVHSKALATCFHCGTEQKDAKRFV